MSRCPTSIRAARPRSCRIWSACATSAAIPIIYVSHALGEIMRLADHLLLLEAGACEPPDRCSSCWRAAICRLGHFEDSGCVFDAVVEEHDPSYQLTYVRIGAGRLAISLKPGSCRSSRARAHRRARCEPGAQAAGTHEHHQHPARHGGDSERRSRSGADSGATGSWARNHCWPESRAARRRSSASRPACSCMRWSRAWHSWKVAPEI
jgi:hypothetical protein